MNTTIQGWLKKEDGCNLCCISSLYHKKVNLATPVSIFHGSIGIEDFAALVGKCPIYAYGERIICCCTISLIETLRQHSHRSYFYSRHLNFQQMEQNGQTEQKMIFIRDWKELFLQAYWVIIKSRTVEPHHASSLVS